MEQGNSKSDCGNIQNLQTYLIYKYKCKNLKITLCNGILDTQQKQKFHTNLEFNLVFFHSVMSVEILKILLW